MKNVVAAVKEIVTNHPEIEVNILSAYLTDSQYALQEKNEWLDRYLPEIDQTHRIFVPCGSDKKRVSAAYGVMIFCLTITPII